MITTIFSAVFVFLIVILVHEFGHFAVAKLVGIRVNEFSIGMGPKIIQKKKGETDYTLRLLPIGGYVKMEGEDEVSNDPRSFNKVPALSRIAVVAAGAIMNFILAIILLSIVSFGMGMPTNTIEETLVNSPAEKVGIQSGDTIIRINGQKIKSWNSIVDKINAADSNKEIEIVVKRNEKNITYSIQPVIEDGRTLIGIAPKYKKSVISAIKGGFENTAMFLKLMFKFLGMAFQGKVSTDDLSGPIGVIHEVGVVTKLGIYNLLNFLGFISINLGFFNLLPIPALDGSRIVFLLIELVRGKPIDPKKEGFVHFTGFILLISLMLIVTYRDIIKFIIFRR
jgi:regulator of sigma E protease